MMFTNDMMHSSSFFISSGINRSVKTTLIASV